MKRRRFRINDDTLTTIVVLCLIFCTFMVITSYFFAFKGIETSELLKTGIAFFGTELALSTLLTLQQRYFDKKDKKKKEEEEQESKVNEDES